MYLARGKARGTPMELFYKLLMNNLYGKFAQRPEEEPDIRHIDSYEGDEFMELWNKDNINMQVVNDFVYVTRKLNRWKIPSHTNPIYSVYITALARSHLWRQRPKNLIYCDTDSYVTTDTMETGVMLGDLKLEAESKKGVFIKPKLYMVDGENPRVKTKGLGRMTKEEFYEMLQKGERSMNTLVKFKSGLRRGLKWNSTLNVTKHLDFEDNKRIWEKPFNLHDHQESEPLILV